MIFVQASHDLERGVDDSFWTDINSLKLSRARHDSPVGTFAAAVNTPNINSIDTDWTKYIVTVRDIEKATGYNLLSNLPQRVQDAIEVKVDSGI